MQLYMYLTCTSIHVMLQQPLIMMTFILQDGWSPLHSASYDGHLDIVKTLIKAGANVNPAIEVQCVGRLHVTFSVIVIYKHFYILGVTAWPVCRYMQFTKQTMLHAHASPQPFVINYKLLQNRQKCTTCLTTKRSNTVHLEMFIEQCVYNFDVRN